jgi:hypothetical protein
VEKEKREREREEELRDTQVVASEVDPGSDSERNTWWSKRGGARRTENVIETDEKVHH